MTPHQPVIIVHGGAGDWPYLRQKPGLAGVRTAADRGFKVLSNGGTSLDAVETAIVSMENNPNFNAGRGSTLNLVGDVEADAAIMDGRTLSGGGVALLKQIRNPIKAARIVMERTDHVLIAGDSARKLALGNGLAKGDLRVRRRVKAWKDGIKELRSKNGDASTVKFKTFQIFAKELSDTVGALAIDQRGNLAAGDSTGGTFLKLPGRIGDSPILGAGLYADNKSGAATATGLGEQAIRLAISKVACENMTRMSAPAAALRTVQYATRAVGPGIGLITLDKHGKYGVAHNTKHLPWAVKASKFSDEGMTGKSSTR